MQCGTVNLAARSDVRAFRHCMQCTYGHFSTARFSREIGAQLISFLRNAVKGGGKKMGRKKEEGGEGRKKKRNRNGIVRARAIASARGIVSGAKQCACSFEND